MSVTRILEIVPDLMAEIGPILKERENTQQKYRFRGVEQVLARVQPVLIKHRVTPAIEVSNHVASHFEERKSDGTPRTTFHASLTLTVTFTALDGSSVKFVSAGEGMDYGGDKATNKAMAAAFKYALTLGLCIPVDRSMIADSDRGRPKAEAQRDKFADISKAIEHENAQDKLRKFKTRIEQLAGDGELSVDQAAAALSQLNDKLKGQAA